MARLKVGVVGVGHLGQHHARILASMPDVELVGVADTRAEQAHAIAERCGTHAYTDFRCLMNQVEAVSIAVPTRYHCDVATPFLERGIPVLIEKPLATSVEEGEKLVTLAATNHTILQVGHIERFNPIWSFRESLPITPRYIAAERLGTYTFRSTDIGVVHDLMIHDIDLVLAMVDAPVAAVSAVGFGIFGSLEDVATARIWFEDGVVADLSASRASQHATRKMRIWCPDIYLGLDFKTRQALLVRPSEHLRRGQLGVEQVDLTQPAQIQAHVFGKLLETQRHQAESAEPLALELQDFLHAVRTGASPKVSGADALRSMRLAGQVVESLRTHTWAAAPGRAARHEAQGIPAPHLFRPGPSLPKSDGVDRNAAH